jgi:hypothetical protein
VRRERLDCTQSASSVGLPFEVADDALEVGLVENGFPFRRAEEESGAAEVVDLAGNPLGVVVGEGQKTIGEDGVVTTGDMEMVLDVAGGLLEVKRFEVVADGNALIEGFEGRKAQLVGQIGLAEEDEGEEGGRIHLVVEQKAELIKDVVGEQVRLVDEEENGAALASQVGEGGAELREQAGEAKGRFGLESEQDLVVEGHGRQVRIGEVDDGVEVAVEGEGEGAQGGRLAGADVAGDEGREALLEGEGEPGLDLLMAAGGKEIGARDGLAERGDAEAVKVIQCSCHCRRSPLVRVVRNEWCRVDPG